MLAKVRNLSVISKIALIFFTYLLTYYLFLGIKTPIPAQGDSFDYHIPISLTIINGDFLNLSANTEIFQRGVFAQALRKMPQWYYPGSSETINSIFIYFGIPLTLSNILAALVLALTLYKLGRGFKLPQNYSLLFSLSFVTLNAVVRWLNAVSVDFWVTTWFAWAILLLENPKKNVSYFAKLGLALGMLIGSKFIALYLFLTIFAIYFRKIINYLNPKNAVAFALPFCLGLFWYVRNFALTGNPFYPVAVLGFKGPFYESERILNEITGHPLDFFNASYGEFHLWIFSILLAIFVICWKVYVKDFKLDNSTKLFIIGIVNLIFFLNFPSSSQPWIMVSGMRYVLPAFMCLMLGTFIYFKKIGKEEFLGYFALGNMLPVISMIYYPKLIFIYLPISLILFNFLKEEDKTKKN